MYEARSNASHQFGLIDDIIAVMLDRCLDVQLESTGTELLFPAPWRIPGKQRPVERIDNGYSGGWILLTGRATDALTHRQEHPQFVNDRRLVEENSQRVDAQTRTVL